MRHLSRIGLIADRRWPLTALLGSLGLVGFLAALAWLPRSYQEQASVAILPASASASASPAVSGGDPDPRLTPPPRQIADLVSRELMSARTARQLAARGFSQSYAVGLGADATGSVLVVTATGSSPGRAQRMLRAVIGQVGTALARRTGRARAGSRIRLTSLTSSIGPALVSSPSARPMVVIGLFGAVVALGCPVVADARLAGRRRARVPALPAAPARGRAGSAR